MCCDSTEWAADMGKIQRGKVVLVERIEPCILLVRGQRVMLDADLAGLYGTTKPSGETRNDFLAIFASN